jgi:hypothetical protein
MSRLLGFALLAAALGGAWAAPAAAADLFALTSGGQIEGEWLNRDEQAPVRYLVKTAAGLTVSLEPLQVADHRRLSPAEVEYRRIAPTYPRTVEGQWKLAEWCRQNRLSQERRRHLEEILALDPDHQQARAHLGYAFVDGQWVTRPQHQRAQGLELYRGRWRTPQEISLLETEAKRDLLRKEWLARLQRWRKMLDTDKARQGWDAIRSIDDPIAVEPLAQLFRRERVRSVKQLYADVLARIDTPESIGVLVHATLNDSDVEVFYYCLDRLTAMQVPHLADRYVTALSDASNERVNRAAVALAQIGDRAVISPLIDALVTVHQRVLPGNPALGPDATAASFSREGGVAFAQNEGPKIQIVRVHNQQVLQALTRLSGGTSFGFDQKAWRYWYAQERQAEARRGTDTLSRRQD